MAALEDHLPTLVEHAPSQWQPVVLNHKLMLAAKNGDAPACRHWLQLGARANAPVFGQSALFWAVSANTPQHHAVVNTLLQAHADIQAINHDGQGLLHVCQNPSVVQRLVDAGIDIDAKTHNEHALTPLESALQRQCTPMIHVLIEHGASLQVKPPYAQALIELRGQQLSQCLQRIKQLEQQMDFLYQQLALQKPTSTHVQTTDATQTSSTANHPPLPSPSAFFKQRAHETRTHDKQTVTSTPSL